jgi:hypothetical protein
MSDPRDHPCAVPGCAQWGSHGFTVGKDRPPVWYCGQHKQIGEARTAPAVVGLAPDAGEPVLHHPQQGRLL